MDDNAPLKWRLFVWFVTTLPRLSTASCRCFSQLYQAQNRRYVHSILIWNGFFRSWRSRTRTAPVCHAFILKSKGSDGYYWLGLLRRMTYMETFWAVLSSKGSPSTSQSGTVAVQFMFCSTRKRIIWVVNNLTEEWLDGSTNFTVNWKPLNSLAPLTDVDEFFNVFCGTFAGNTNSQLSVKMVKIQGVGSHKFE